MPKTPIKYTIKANGSTDTFSIPWPYIDKSYVKIFLNDQDISETVTWLSPSTIKVYPLPLVGQTLTITRDTPSDKPLVKFKDGSRLEDADIKRGMAQSLHVMEEVLDEMGHATADLITDSAEAKAAAAAAKTSATAASASASLSQSFAHRAEDAADRAEAVAGGEYPDVELNVVTEVVEDGESLAGSYDPETGTLTFKIPENMVLESGSGGGVELTDRVDLDLSSVGASAKAVKTAYDTAVMSRPLLASTSTAGIVRLATPDEHLQKASGVAAQPSEIASMIEATLSKASISSPVQDGSVARGGDYGEIWTKLSDWAYGWEPIETAMVNTGLVPRKGSQTEVSTGKVSTTELVPVPPFVGPVEHAESHRITQHLFLESEEAWVPDADGYLCGLVLVGGGQAGGARTFISANSGYYAGVGGQSGRIRLVSEIIKVTKGTPYSIVVGAGGGQNMAQGFASSFGGYTSAGETALYAPGGSRGQSSGGLGDDQFPAKSGGPGTRIIAFGLTTDAPGAAGNTTTDVGGGGGGAGGILLPGLMGYVKATASGGGAGIGLGAGGGGANSDSTSGGGRGAQGAVFFTFIRHPGGIE